MVVPTEIPVTREVPVEVTRIVEQTVVVPTEIPVTREVPVEVTRIVEQTVVATREIEVTRVVVATATATPMPAFNDGRGDDVITATADNGLHTWHITHNGRSNFAVIAHDQCGGRDGLVNEIGSYSGNVLVRVGNGILELCSGEITVEIIADGNWSIEWR